MDYIPKKDWVSGQKLMHTDMNRIEGTTAFTPTVSVYMNVSFTYV